jgi:hypothetical protein
MFPSLTQMGASSPALAELVPAKQEVKDELIEFGAILALLKIAFG